MLGIKQEILPEIKMSGERKTDIYPHIAESAGLKKTVPVYCVGSHDTASAVASVPTTTDNYAFLSSGTWSLIGIENEKRIINDLAYSEGFTNEGTVSGKYRLIRNIMGLWIIQNCKREWDKEKAIGWDEIVTQAEKALEFQAFIDVNNDAFFNGDHMIQNIKKFCSDTNQKVPETIGEIARTVYESLAMSYREAFIGLEQIKGNQIDVLHIVGGGSKNAFLNQMTANALNRRVTAGPAEATAIGNLMVQVKAAGGIKDFTEVRTVIRNSFDIESFLPIKVERWTENYKRYKLIISGKKHEES